MKKNLFTLPTLIAILISGLFLLSAPIQANDIDPSPETTRLLASQCAQCHGTTGNSLGDFDSIAGENFEELLSELIEMKGSGDNKVMHKQIEGYTDKQIWFIADYYANLPAIENNEEETEETEETEELKKLTEKQTEELKKIAEKEKEAQKKAKEKE